MRCDWSRRRFGCAYQVSIHTPTWGVTKVRWADTIAVLVSIHTPTWGVTHVIDLKYGAGVFQSTHLHEVWRIYPMYRWYIYTFQSTHLHEVWRSWSNMSKMQRHVSIHTPTWGVTVETNGRWFIRGGFNPHTYMRCDMAIGWWRDRRLTFQSTHLHEVWPYAG